MTRGTFRSHNKVGETMSFQTNSDSGTTFDPIVVFATPIGDRVSWDLGEGSGYTATNSLSYTYSDTGSTKTVTIRTNKLSDLGEFYGNSDNIIGNINMSGWGLKSQFLVQDNPDLTGITHTYSNGIFSAYYAYFCNLIGNHDLSMFPNLGGYFKLYSNANLTGITHTASTQVFINYNISSCNLTGNHDLSMFPNFGGSFLCYSNSNLTSITHGTSSQPFIGYQAQFCDLTGTHDLSMLSGLGGSINIYSNPNLTGITHTASTETFNSYIVNGNNLTGNHDVSMFPNLGGIFNINGNSNLTSISHGASSEVFTFYWVYNCNLIGPPLDVSMLSALGGSFDVSANSGLRGVTFPYTTQTFANTNTGNSAIDLSTCGLDGTTDFWRLSGITMDVNSTHGADIEMQNSGLSKPEVDDYLVDFSGITSNNITRWSGVTLNIGGITNAAPSATGLSAVAYLTGATAQWTVTIS